MMQPGSITPATHVVTATKAAPAADTASWQAALAQAGEQPAPSHANTPTGKPAARHDAKETAPDDAATAQPELAAIEKTLSQPTKKPSPPASGSTAPTVKHEKKAAPTAIPTVTHPETASPPAAPKAEAPATASQAASSAPTQPAGQSGSATTAPAPASIKLTPTHGAAPALPAPPQAGTTALTQAATPATTATPQAQTTEHTATSETLPATIASTSSKPPLPASIEDTPPSPPVTAAEKTDSASDKQTPAITPATFMAPTVHDAMPTPQPTPVTTGPTPVTQPSAAGLAAAVTAMHQAGQSGAVLRLDPPGLGELSVHVALSQNGSVNVLFIPSTQAATTTLQNNLNGLGPALAQSGISLGQAQIGGQFNQNAGQGSYQPPATPAFTPQPAGFETETPSGLSAYA